MELRYCGANLRFLISKQPVTGLTDGNNVIVSEMQAERRGVSPGNYPDLRPLSGDALLSAMTASYNEGCGNALISIAVGLSPDVTTTPGTSGHGDYSADVLQRANNFRIIYGS
jgi:hypothetical protein